MVKVKICGVTNLEDAKLASGCGADLIGMLVNVRVPTPRNIPVETARAIISELRGSVKWVVVTTPRSVADLEELQEAIQPDAIQIHSDFELPNPERIHTSLIQAIHVGENALDKIRIYAKQADYFLLDTKTDRIGGSGVLNDLEACAEIVKWTEKPTFLSGGLNPENLEAAVRRVQPYGVDVASGVESAPGKKDPSKLRRFVELAKSL